MFSPPNIFQYPLQFQIPRNNPAVYPLCLDDSQMPVIIQNHELAAK